VKDQIAPRIATWLLGRLLPPTDREALLGDLIEEYAIRVRSDPASMVDRWYWGQVYRSIPQAQWSAIRRGGASITLGTALAAFIAAGALESASLAALSRVLVADANQPTARSVIVGLATIVLGGYVAAWIRPGAAQALAGIEMIAVVILMVTMTDSAPLWYGLTFLIMAPLAALAGGTLHVGRRTGRGPSGHVEGART
jgi:hypothetical protein